MTSEQEQDALRNADRYVSRATPLTDEELDAWTKYVVEGNKTVRRIAFVLAFLAAVAACTWAGYEIGVTRGRGWRGAMIDHGCQVVCQRIET